MVWEDFVRRDIILFHYFSRLSETQRGLGSAGSKYKLVNIYLVRLDFEVTRHEAKGKPSSNITVWGS